MIHVAIVSIGWLSQYSPWFVSPAGIHDHTRVHLCSGPTKNERSPCCYVVCLTIDWFSCNWNSRSIHHQQQSMEDWNIYLSIKINLIAGSLCVASKRYRYRLRDEVVNVQYLVEDVYDRELAERERDCRKQ